MNLTSVISIPGQLNRIQCKCIQYKFLHLRVRKIRIWRVQSEYTGILIVTKEGNTNMIGIILYILHLLNEAIREPDLHSENRIQCKYNYSREFLHLRKIRIQLYTSILIVNEGNTNMIGIILYILHLLNEAIREPDLHNENRICKYNFFEFAKDSNLTIYWYFNWRKRQYDLNNFVYIRSQYFLNEKAIRHLDDE